MSEQTRNDLRRLAPEVDTDAGIVALWASYRRRRLRNRAVGAVLAGAAIFGLASGIARLGDRSRVDYIVAGEQPASGIAGPDRGPLNSRLGASVVWTGSEMIVTGGFNQAQSQDETDLNSAASDYDFLTDGAAFDPESETWRPMAAQPVTTGTWAKSFWTGEEVLLIHAGGGLSYDLNDDAWTPLAPPPFELPDLVEDNLTFEAVWSGEALIIWRPDTDQVAAYDPRNRQWAEMPGPNLSATYPATLLADGNRLVALSSGWPSSASAVSWDVHAAEWVDGRWRHAEPVTFSTENQSNVALIDAAAMVDSSVVVWGEHSSDPGPTWILDPSGDWTQAPPMPISTGKIQVSSPVLGGRVMAVAEGADLALFSMDSRTWTRMKGPEAHGFGFSIWTGSELLGWDGASVVRWTPPATD